MKETPALSPKGEDSPTLSHQRSVSLCPHLSFSLPALVFHLSVFLLSEEVFRECVCDRPVSVFDEGVCVCPTNVKRRVERELFVMGAKKKNTVHVGAGASKGAAAQHPGDIALFSRSYAHKYTLIGPP